MGILLVKGPSYATFLSLFSSFLTFGFNWFAHFVKLWATQIRPHSTVVLERPLNKNLWKPRLYLICPKTGSTSHFRLR